jgi:hypothetical protein
MIIVRTPWSGSAGMDKAVPCTLRSFLDVGGQDFGNPFGCLHSGRHAVGRQPHGARDVVGVLMQLDHELGELEQPPKKRLGSVSEVHFHVGQGVQEVEAVLGWPP